MIKIVLAEDQNIVRNGIRMLLETDANIKIVAEAVDANQALEIVQREGEIDIILIDIKKPTMNGISLIKDIKVLRPNIHVVILSADSDEKFVVSAFSEGASGYMLKNVSSDELIFGLKYIYNGGRYLCTELTMRLIDDAIHNKHYKSTKVDIDFSLREREVLNHIAGGLTNSEMSEKLFISKRTIEGHRQSLIEKTGSKNTAALIRFAVLNGIIN